MDRRRAAGSGRESGTLGKPGASSAAPISAALPADVHMHGDATGHGNVYQAAQSITINYGEDSNVRQASELRQAAVVVQLSAAGEDREGVFVGRDQLIAAIMTRLDPAKPSPADTVVSVISGLAGVGKTALARHAAALALDRGWFTAAVFADFHGYDPDSQSRVVPAQLFASILRTLGMSPNQIPISSSEQAADYHSMLSSMATAGQRVLLLFDNVSSSAQVKELLPETRAHRVLITSRHILGDIDNVGILELDTLPPGEAIDVLTEVLRERHPGDLRISQCPDDAGDLARLCGYLPLALRISGALLAEDPLCRSAIWSGISRMPRPGWKASSTASSPYRPRSTCPGGSCSSATRWLRNCSWNCP
jgi:Mrp family chromosome partitioning ATPase